MDVIDGEIVFYGRERLYAAGWAQTQDAFVVAANGGANGGFVVLWIGWWKGAGPKGL